MHQKPCNYSEALLSHRIPKQSYAPCELRLGRKTQFFGQKSSARLGPGWQRSAGRSGRAAASRLLTDQFCCNTIRNVADLY